MGTISQAGLGEGDTFINDWGACEFGEEGTPRPCRAPPFCHTAGPAKPSEARFMTAAGLAVGAVCATLGVARIVVAATPLRPACALAAPPQRCKIFSLAQ